MVPGSGGVLVEPSDHAGARRAFERASAEWKKSLGENHFEVAIVGAQFQARVLRRGRQPVDEASAIEPLLREFRESMWQARSDLGLWYSMSFSLGADSRVLPSGFDYESRPTIDEVPADLAEAKADLRRAPQPERWVPLWLS